ncbi:MAG: hypothetical protein RJA49_2379 [Actinomycetota bacterium]
MNVNDIPVAHTPVGGYGARMPPPVLTCSDEPLPREAPLIRGVWRAIEVLADGEVQPAHPVLGQVQRIEQSGDRVVITGGGVVHDMRCDGTMEHGVDDVAAIDKVTRIAVVATYERGVHVLRPVGLPIEVTRRLDGDELVWHYAGFVARLKKVHPDEELLAAAATGDMRRAHGALEALASVEARDHRNRSPLLLAAAHDHVEMAQLLVAEGADPNAMDDQHDTPWLVTGVTGSVAMLEVLLAAGADLTIRNRYGGVSVIPASERGHLEYVRRVVQTGIDVNHLNDLHWTALLETVILGDGSATYVEIARTLLAAGADPAIGDRDGVTPLQHAERLGHRLLAETLRQDTLRHAGIESGTT